MRASGSTKELNHPKNAAPFNGSSLRKQSSLLGQATLTTQISLKAVSKPSYHRRKSSERIVKEDEAQPRKAIRDFNVFEMQGRLKAHP